MNICYSVDTATGAAQIKSGSLTKIVEKLTGLSREAKDASSLQRALLVTLPGVADPIRLLELVVQRYNLPPAPNMTPSEQKQFRAEFSGPIQLRCLALLRSWLEQFPNDLASDPSGRLKPGLASLRELN
jgi:hypothetical protein